MPTVPSLASETFEKVSAPKKKLYIHNLKELKLLVPKNPDCSPFKPKAEKTHCYFVNLFFAF